MIRVVVIYYKRGKSENDFEYKEACRVPIPDEKKALTLAKFKQYITKLS